MTKFNEDTRVKNPSILHLCRLGYEYISLKNTKWDLYTNIFHEIFKKSIIKINPDVDEDQAERLFLDISLLLDNEDLGKAFYEKLISNSGVKLIDFDNFDNNTFNVVTELTYKNGDDEFRPDIILLINGMPLAFIEVKKPNNRDGIIAKRERINRRFQNKKFRKFVNITQLMVFSNNMEYDNNDIEPLQGAFYASPSYKKPIFNYFREEQTLDLSKLLTDENDELENFILKDNNLTVIKNSPEFITNKNTNTPTNQISTSLFSKGRLAFNDASIGGMVVCDSSDQAKEMFEIFNNKYADKEQDNVKLPLAAEPQASYGEKLKHSYKVKTAALILYDIGTKDERKQWGEEFKEGEFDLLFVYNMLLTGFDAKRLKKLYIGRVIKRHNLLQTLTRVNRTYKNFKYGYVVDFADIRAEFVSTNKAYFDELQAELGDEMEFYSNLFKSKEEIEEKISEIKEILFHYDTENAELFSQQISKIQDRNIVLKIKKALGNAKSLYNLIRLFGHLNLLEKIDFKKSSQLYREAENHLALLNTKEALENNIDNTNLLNVALEDVLFHFTKISEEKLVLADKLKDSLRKIRETLNSNFDKKDPEFVSLYEELKRLFDKKNLDEITQDGMRKNIGALTKIYEKVKELNRQNNLLKDKYNSDPKYARIHKRLVEKGTISEKESKIFEALQSVKQDADLQVLQNTKLLDNESYFSTQMMRLVIDQFKNKNKILLNADASKKINNLVVTEYINEFYGKAV